MNVSINPSYYCNFRCPHCYLSEDQLSSSTLLPIDVLQQRLQQLSGRGDIKTIDLYGGEIATIKGTYVDQLIDLSLEFSPTVNVITNFSFMHPAFNRSDITLFVSYDFNQREKHEIVLHNMVKSQRPINVITLATPAIMQIAPSTIINTFNKINCIGSVEVKPYSSNQSNQLPFNNKDYESFIKSLIIESENANFDLVNKWHLDDVINGTRRSFSDDHVYITPSGDFAVLDFDLNGNEFFKHVTLLEYDMWCERERDVYTKEEPCASCEYVGRCLSEHLKPVNNFQEHSCSGFFNLIKWYDSEY